MLYIGTSLIEPGELLFRDDFTDPDLTKNWEITGGEWVAGDGTCVGTYRENAGGLIYSHRQFPGDVMLDFFGTILPPCHNDLNWSFRAKGWDYGISDADTGYIAGLNGWYIDRTGIEKYPGCALQALTNHFKAEPGREYHIQTGLVGQTCFIAVDGDMIITLSDPNPITAPDCNRVGLGTYCSQIRFRDCKVYRPLVTPTEMYYTPHF